MANGDTANGDTANGDTGLSESVTGGLYLVGQDGSQTVHLSTDRVSVVLSATGQAMPRLAYWGPRLGDKDLLGLNLAQARPVPRASLDTDPPLGLIAEVGSGFPGMPGLEGHRLGPEPGPESASASPGTGFSPRFGAGTVSVAERGDRTEVLWRLSDDRAGLGLTVTVGLCRNSDVLLMGATVTNTGPGRYVVDLLAPGIALPSTATELMTISGRWTLEFQPQRHRWEPGAWVSENRRGRTSHDRIPSIFAGTDGFTETSGEVWGLTLGWSGNSRVAAERVADGRRHIQLGDLPAGGECILEPGATLDSPTIHGAYSPAGVGEVSLAFHRFLRGRANHPGPDRPRPVLLNTWEAVYFDHDLPTLKELASRAAEVGVERFVLDDGWFVGRNDDTAALGDWIVDRAKYPEGLRPLVDHVTGLGMEFGLWFEPEMVNPDSELFTQHPDWVLHAEGYQPLEARNQLVLNLANPDAWNLILDRMDAILSEYDISYIKWDMNRDHLQPTHDGRAGSRSQTLAVYRLFDELRRRHPGVEIESCSSGGARADFEILTRSERIWTSDSNDALDRQHIQRGFSLLFPPEVMGSHIGPPVSHTTGRQHDLGFRAASAFLGHLGIEWNLLTTTAEERKELAGLIGHHKAHRPLLHSGDWRRLDSPDPSVNTMGVVATDRSEALFVHARIASTLTTMQAPIRFVGLDPDRTYRITTVPLPGPTRDRGLHAPGWLTTEQEGQPVEVTGRVLMTAGLQPPILDPESAIIVHLQAR